MPNGRVQTLRDGGRILATAETSLRDEKGMSRSNFELKNVLGVSWQESSEEHFAIEGNPEPEPSSGKLQKVPTLGTTLAHLFTVDPAGSVLGGKDPLPMEITEWPVFTKNSYENGQAIYAAFDIGRYYAMHGDQHIGTWMTNLINSILPVRQIEVKAPRTVEVTVWQQKECNRTIIHLANRTVPWTLPTNNRQITEIIPVTDIELSLKMSCANPTVSSRNAEITVKTDAEECNRSRVISRHVAHQPKDCCL
ncbi:MAG: hypothetical protein DDT33_00847 [Firmicutes bacterium]|nr:hypothetical protein [Bacillota bacterium]